MQKLRELYEESMAGQMQALQEKEQLQSELSRAHVTIRVSTVKLAIRGHSVHRQVSTVDKVSMYERL